MPEPDREPGAAQGKVTRAVHDRIAAHRAIAGQLISLSQLLRRPVVNDVGTRVGRVSDVVVRWVDGATYPRVTGVLVSTGRGYALIDAADVTLTQTLVQLRTDRLTVARPLRHEGDVALARDVLDRQLVDLAGIQVVRAADVYLLHNPGGWELAGVDVGLNAFLRRLLPKAPENVRRQHKAIDWVHLQTFLPPYLRRGA